MSKKLVFYVFLCNRVVKYGSKDSKSRRSSQFNDQFKSYNDFYNVFCPWLIRAFWILNHWCDYWGVSRGWSVASGVSDRWKVTHDMWHVTCDTWHVTHDMWHMTCDMWKVTCDTWHVTHYMWHMTCVMSHVTCDKWLVTKENFSVPKKARQVCHKSLNPKYLLKYTY